MEWSLRWGGYVETLQKRQAKGEPTPLDEIPELYPGLEDYYHAFCFLSSYRSPEGGFIPLSEIKDYFHIFMSEDPDSLMSFAKIIHKMDARFVQYQNEKREQKRNQTKGQNQ